MHPAGQSPRDVGADDARWQERLAAVVDHRQRTGRWLENARRRHRHGRLDLDRAGRLERSGVPLGFRATDPRLGPDVRAEQIRPLAAAGLTTAQIAEQVGLSEGHVRAIILRYDLPRPPRPGHVEVPTVLGGVGPSKAGPLSVDPDLLARDRASRWPPPNPARPASLPERFHHDDRR
jgi:hypothetical protein